MEVNFSRFKLYASKPMGIRITVMTAVKKILILAANPKGTTPLRLGEEVREIDEGLRRAKNRNQFSIQQRWAST